MVEEAVVVVVVVVSVVSPQALVPVPVQALVLVGVVVARLPVRE